jgi:Septum formation initiator
LNVGDVAGRVKGRTQARRRKAAPLIGRRRLRLLWAIGLIGIAVYLYYRPIASYVETRNDLTTRRAEVESLGLVRAELGLRLVNSTSVESLEREARRINYVKPGERLFVVKGIPAWRKARGAGSERP